MSQLNLSSDDMLGTVVEVHAWKGCSAEVYSDSLENAKGKRAVLPREHYVHGDTCDTGEAVQNGDFVIVLHESGTPSYYKSFGALTDKHGTLQQRLSTAYQRGDAGYQMKASESIIGKPFRFNFNTLAYERIKCINKQPLSIGSKADKGILVLLGPPGLAGAQAVKAMKEQRQRALAADAEAETEKWPDVENIVDVPVHDAGGEALAGLQKWENKKEMVNLAKQGTDGKTLFSSQEKPNFEHSHEAWTRIGGSTWYSVKNTFIHEPEEHVPSPKQQRCHSVPARRQDE